MYDAIPFLTIKDEYFLFLLIIDLQIAFIYLNYCTLFCTSCFLSESRIHSSCSVRSASHFLCHSSIKLK